METAVQTPPSYSRSGTGPRNPPEAGGLSTQHRRAQVTAPTYNRGRGGPPEGGIWTRKRRGSFGANSGNITNSAGNSNNGGCHENNNNNNSNNNNNMGNNGNNNNGTGNRCKRRKRQHPDIVLPTKFMLGGSITDPLNLRSLENEEVNRLANQTPVASPAPAAGGGSERVEVIIPRDINDPLNLNAPEPPAPTENACADQVNRQQPNSSNSSEGSGKRRGQDGANKPQKPQTSVKKNRRRRNRNNHHLNYQHNPYGGRMPAGWNAADGAPGTWHGPAGDSQRPLTGGSHRGPVQGPSQNDNTGRARGGFRGPNSQGNRQPSTEVPASSTQQQQQDSSTSSANCGNGAGEGGGNANAGPGNSNKKTGGGSNNQRFRYGNYNRYYGYRNGADGDSRLPLFKRKWFENKVCLDIGCNVGHVTLSVARDHAPREIIGMDIDPALIRIARKNVRHYVHEENVHGAWFPGSCTNAFGPIAVAPVAAADGQVNGGSASGSRDGASSSNSQPVSFPYNVVFMRGNYVLDSDELLDAQREEFDTIMCLSTSKWIQLNFGDEGLKRTFKRVFRQLRPGGRFVFEPQPLSSYHKFCTPIHRENFRRMRLKPDEFPEYLTREVGFASCKILGVGSHGAKNFQRPLYLLRKAKADESADNAGDNGQASTAKSDGSPAAKRQKLVPETKKSDSQRREQTNSTMTNSNTPSTPSAQQSSQPTPSPAHECDTTTASIE